MGRNLLSKTWAVAVDEQSRFAPRAGSFPRPHGAEAPVWHPEALDTRYVPAISSNGSGVRKNGVQGLVAGGRPTGVSRCPNSQAPKWRRDSPPKLAVQAPIDAMPMFSI